MQMEIQARDFPLTEALGSYIKRRINFVLSSRYDQIQRIIIRLSDINGPRGGIDKRCQIQISLPRLACHRPGQPHRKSQAGTTAQQKPQAVCSPQTNHRTHDKPSVHL